MARRIRLSETELTRLIYRVINEAETADCKCCNAGVRPASTPGPMYAAAEEEKHAECCRACEDENASGGGKTVSNGGRRREFNEAEIANCDVPCPGGGFTGGLNCPECIEAGNTIRGRRTLPKTRLQNSGRGEKAIDSLRHGLGEIDDSMEIDPRDAEQAGYVKASSSSMAHNELMGDIDMWCIDNGFTESGDMAMREMPTYDEDIEDLMFSIEEYCGSVRG